MLLFTGGFSFTATSKLSHIDLYRWPTNLPSDQFLYNNSIGLHVNRDLED